MSNEFEKIPKFKYWLQEQDITQDRLAEMSHLSIRTIHKLVNTGIANKSTILLVSLTLGLKEDELIEMLITQQNKEHFEQFAK